MEAASRRHPHYIIVKTPDPSFSFPPQSQRKQCTENAAMNEPKGKIEFYYPRTRFSSVYATSLGQKAAGSSQFVPPWARHSKHLPGVWLGCAPGTEATVSKFTEVPKKSVIQ